MSFVENQGAKIYWDEQGSGEPLLLHHGPQLSLLYVASQPPDSRKTLSAPSLLTIVAWARAMRLRVSIPLL